MIMDTINQSFDIKGIQNNQEKCPWEITDKFEKYVHFYGKYACLSPGSWLDDVIIENAIKTTAENSRKKDSVAF